MALARLSAPELEQVGTTVGKLRPLHEGPLWKQRGLLSRPAPRFVFLFPSSLLIAHPINPDDDESELRMKRLLALHGLRAQASTDDACALILREPSGKSSCLRAKSGADRDVWVDTILVSIAREELGEAPPPPTPPVELTDADHIARITSYCLSHARYATVASTGVHSLIRCSRTAAELRRELRRLPPPSLLATAPPHHASALHTAVALALPHAIAPLCERAPSLLDQTDEHGFTPLLSAAVCCARSLAPQPPMAAERAAQLFHALLHARASPDAGVTFDSPLVVCTAAGCEDLSLSLLERGASPHAISKGSGLPALHLAIQHRMTRLVTALLEGGVGANQHGPEGSALHLAAAVHPPCASILFSLLSHGAQPNDEWRGEPPLCRLPSLSAACADASELSGLCGAVETLVKGGARLDALPCKLSKSEGRLDKSAGKANSFEEWQPHPMVQHVARQAEATRAADPRVPQLMLCQNNSLYSRLAAQLASPPASIPPGAPCSACGSKRGGRRCALLGIPTCESCCSKRAFLNDKGQRESLVCDAAFNMLCHLQAIAATQPQSLLAIAAPPVSLVSSSRSTDTCVICMEAEAVMCLVPCGHMCLCSACSTLIMQRTRQCPVCRQLSEQAIKVFKP
ncbi:MAG: hypothetical protein SGPRY_011094 [Prymnesium sp.]